MKKLCLFAVLFGFAGLASPQQPAKAPQKAEPPVIDVPVVRGRGYIPPTPEQRQAHHDAAAKRHGNKLMVQAKFQAIPAAFDCRDKGWVPPIGDQGQCGSCYLYSTVYGTMSSAFIRAGYGKADGSFLMSVQYGMDCHNFGGCDGGNGTEVIAWALTNGWYAEAWTDVDGKVHKDYPTYSARSLSCRKVAGARLWKIADWGYATGDQSNRPATIAEIKTAMFNYGPLNVSLDADGQFDIGTTTITILGANINHEIEAIAFDDNHDNGDGTKGAVLLKNQWSKSWGVAGVRWLAYHAVNRLVDIFWVNAGSLPPPPPPPVDFPPIITSGSVAMGTIGQPFAYQIVATNSPVSFGAVGLPAGLAINAATGSIAGTPAAAATTQVTLTATNAAGAGAALLAIIVGTTPPPPPPPGGLGTVTWTINGVTSTYELFPLGSRQKIQEILGPMAP